MRWVNRKEAALSTKKHLVLDPDVHAKLSTRKRRSNLTIREIGNTMLRSVLSRPSLSEIIGKRLVEAGIVTAEAYERVRAEALQDAAVHIHEPSRVVHWTPRGTFVSGSWEAQETFRSPSGDYQVLEAWARDGREHPMPTHCHKGIEILFVVNGALLATLEDAQAEAILAGSVLRIPATMSHTIAPVARETRAVIVLTPPEICYTQPGSGEPPRT